MYYWIETSASPECGFRGELDEQLIRSKIHISAKNYFIGRDGDPGQWDLHYKRSPCDISATHITHVVSENFKEIVESMKIKAEFHKTNILVSGKIIDLNYYFPKVLETAEFIDLTSKNVRVAPETSRRPGSISFNRRTCEVLYSSIGDSHWVRQPRANGNAWIVSQEFKDKIENQGLTNFRFVPAIESKTK